MKILFTALVTAVMLAAFQPSAQSASFGTVYNEEGCTKQPRDWKDEARCPSGGSGGGSSE